MWRVFKFRVKSAGESVCFATRSNFLALRLLLAGAGLLDTPVAQDWELAGTRKSCILQWPYSVKGPDEKPHRSVCLAAAQLRKVF